MSSSLIPSAATSLRTALVTALLAAICASCGSASEYPNQNEVARHLEPECSLVSMEGFEPIATTESDGREIITRYTANCVSASDNQAHRATGSMSLREKRGSLGSRSWLLLEDSLLTNASPSPAPQNAPGANGTMAIDQTYSDAPECNALTRRIDEEMLPCMQRVAPEKAELLQVAINNQRNATRLSVDLADSRNVLMQVEEACRNYWRQMQHQLDGNAPEGECLLDH